MSLHDTIRTESVLALKARDSQRRACLSFLVSKLDGKAKSEGREDCDDPTSMAVLRRCSKDTVETLEAAIKLGRTSDVSNLHAEIATIESFLPAPISEDTITEAVLEAVQQLNPTSLKNMGGVIGFVSARLLGADKSVIARLAKQLIQIEIDRQKVPA